MLCEWCDACDGLGEFYYSGWVLARRVDDAWLVFPWGGGGGGTPLTLTADHVPEGWRDAGAEGVASEATIVAATHAVDGGGLADLMVDVQETLTAWPVTRVRWGKGKWTGSVGEQRYEFAGLSGLGHDDAQMLQSAPLWWWAGLPGQPSWQFEDAAGYLVEKRNAAEQRKWQRDRQNAFKSASDAAVNPYNFVSLRERPAKREPSLHLGLGDGRVSGWVSVRLTARSPLALSGAGAGTVGDPYRPAVIDGRWVVPGSQFAGAVRSLHEALTDSCLRVIDRDYRPVYRDMAKPQEPGQWRMAVVEAAGRAVRLCDSVPYGGQDYPAVWVEARHLGAGLVDSSQLFHFDVAAAQLAIPRQRFRLERLRGAVPVLCSQEPGSCSTPHWRTIVAAAIDTRAFQPKSWQHPYHLPFAPTSSGGPVNLDSPVLQDYRRCAEDAGDVVLRRRGETPVLIVENVGVRQETTAELADGQVVWVRMAGPNVVRVIPSVLWRNPGEHAVSERFGEYGPCTDPAWLCPSCRLFGMVDERASESTGAARVDAYRGHIRFGHGTVSDVDSEPTRLREMGRPRAGAGQFYLTNAGSKGRQARPGQRPLREWGSAADGTPPRQIRGRKFYWANSTGTRHLAGGDAHDAMSSYHCLSPAGTTVTFSVWFDNVTAEQLGALLVSLDPNLLRQDRLRQLVHDAVDSPALVEALDQQLCLHVGKGKGLGLGTVVGTVVGRVESPAEDRPGHEATLAVWTADRYRNPSGQPETVDAARYVEAFVRGAVRERQVQGWPPVLALSALDWVPVAAVGYPPDDNPGPEFRFDFWKRSNGAAGTVRIGSGANAVARPPTLVVLPDADARDVTLARPWLDGEL